MQSEYKSKHSKNAIFVRIHKIISHIHAKIHTDVKNLKPYLVSFACSVEFVIALQHKNALYIHYAFYTVMELNQY